MRSILLLTALRAVADGQPAVGDGDGLVAADPELVRVGGPAVDDVLALGEDVIEGIAGEDGVAGDGADVVGAVGDGDLPGEVAVLLHVQERVVRLVEGLLVVAIDAVVVGGVPAVGQAVAAIAEDGAGVGLVAGLGVDA